MYTFVDLDSYVGHFNNLLTPGTENLEDVSQYSTRKKGHFTKLKQNTCKVKG